MNDAELEKKLDAIEKSARSGGGSDLSTYLLIMLVLSGCWGYDLGKSGPCTVKKDVWDVTNRDSGIVTEIVSDRRSGSTFIVRDTELQRIWNLNANEVTTSETKSGLFFFVPFYSYDETTRPIADADQGSVQRARALLNAAPK